MLKIKKKQKSMKISEVITKLVKTLSVEGDIEVVNIDCDGSITYNNTAKTEYIDLGLPSGTLWAKCNYGATKETESGKYFKWDEAQELPITLPTSEQCCELIKNTTSKWIENYDNSGVKGRLFISKKNGITLFFPAVGTYYNNSFNFVGSNGHVLSSSLDSKFPDYAYGLYFDSGYVYPKDYITRCIGASVRSVSK